MNDEAKAILALIPNAKFQQKPDGTLIWADTRVQPTETEIQAKITELQAQYDAKAYARARRQKFPNEHDLLVALWEKVMEDRSESADALQVIRTQVKSDNPKP